jgi:hypothetical protein
MTTVFTAVLMAIPLFVMGFMISWSIPIQVTTQPQLLPSLMKKSPVLLMKLGWVVIATKVLPAITTSRTVRMIAIPVKEISDLKASKMM